MGSVEAEEHTSLLEDGLLDHQKVFLFLFLRINVFDSLILHQILLVLITILHFSFFKVNFDWRLDKFEQFDWFRYL